MKRRAYRSLPDSLKPIARRGYDAAVIGYFALNDVFDFLRGNHDDASPPKWMIAKYKTGSTDFRKRGELLLEYVIDVCGLNESARILDVGCGLGLFARSLTTFLKDNGRYDGFDVNAKAIAWCRDNIAGGFPRFHFQAIEIGNKLYNPKGTGRASDFVFPYSDDSFDFVLVSSVFTHMFPQEVENYFSEIFRVLKTGGKCLVSFWLLNEESSKLMRGTTPPLDFPYHFQHYSTTLKDLAEGTIAYEEQYVRKVLDKNGFTIAASEYGSWCGRRSARLEHFGGILSQDWFAVTK